MLINIICQHPTKSTVYYTYSFLQRTISKKHFDGVRIFIAHRKKKKKDVAIFFFTFFFWSSIIWQILEDKSGINSMHLENFHLVFVKLCITCTCSGDSYFCPLYSNIQKLFRLPFL